MCIHTRDTNEKVQISSNTDTKLAKPPSPVLSQLKYGLKSTRSFFRFEVTCNKAAGDEFFEMAWFIIHVRAKHGAVSAKRCYFSQQIYCGSKVKLQLLSDIVFQRK
jgi:hypothetical protein